MGTRHVGNALALLALAVSVARAEELPWRAASLRVEARRDEIARRLEAVLPRLRGACAGTELLARIDPAPPTPLEIGWGLLPEIRRDAPPPAVAPQPAEVRFSLVELEAWAGAELRRLAAIESAVASAAPARDRLAQAVEDQRRVSANLDVIEQQIAYHAFWQPEAARHRDFFAGKNAQLAEWRALAGREGTEAAEARQRLAESVVTFVRTPSLSVESWAGGERVLRVPLATDVDDPFFLAAFEDAVERTWNSAPAMRAARLRVVLDWSVNPVSALYPEGPPARGEDIELDCHRGHFDEPLVLTSGAAATHAFAGAIVLGPGDISGRDLAHELGHLLGFSDGYLRAHDGMPEDPDGVVFIELRELGTDLMSAPGTGLVTEGMVERLLGGYAG